MCRVFTRARVIYERAMSSPRAADALLLARYATRAAAIRCFAAAADSHAASIDARLFLPIFFRHADASVSADAIADFDAAAGAMPLLILLPCF